jgi:hypothetical protein
VRRRGGLWQTEAVQTQMTLIGNTDEPGFSANARQACIKCGLL